MANPRVILVDSPARGHAIESSLYRAGPGDLCRGGKGLERRDLLSRAIVHDGLSFMCNACNMLLVDTSIIGRESAR